MLQLDRPIFFLATKDAPRSREFYERTLGLKFIADEPFALVFEVGGLELRIQKVVQLTEVHHTVLGWTVDDVRSTIAALVKNGVRFERYPQLPQDADGVWQTPSGARVAWFKDPDGNTLSLTQH